MFNPHRFKVQLKLSIKRLQLLQEKHNSLNLQKRKEIGTLLEKGKEESARSQVEHIIRNDILIEAMEILENYCHLLLARSIIVDDSKVCEESIVTAVSTLIWAAPRVPKAKEIALVRDQLAHKYGKEFMVQTMENKDDRVDSKIVLKLETYHLDPFLVERYLEEIARAYDIKWRSNHIQHEEEQDVLDDGGSGSGEQVKLLPPLQTPSSMPDDMEDDSRFDLPEIPTNSPMKKNNGVSQLPNNNAEDPNDFDALARRLDALRRK